MFSLIETLKKHKWYDNEESENEMHVSASSFANETLELWYSKYNYPREEKLSDATIGSLIHIALEQLMTELNYSEDMHDRFIIERRFRKYLGDYLITGAPDLIDTKDRVIFDYKTAKNYSRKMLEKEGKYHRYAIQMAIYNWLLEEDHTCKILWIMKDSSAPKGEPVFIEQEIEIMSRDEIQVYMQEKLDILSCYDKDIIPDKCKDLWTRNVNKAVVDTKCKYYCGYKNICKYYNQSPKQAVSSW